MSTLFLKMEFTAFKRKIMEKGVTGVSDRRKPKGGIWMSWAKGAARKSSGKIHSLSQLQLRVRMTDVKGDHGLDVVRFSV